MLRELFNRDDCDRLSVVHAPDDVARARDSHAAPADGLRWVTARHGIASLSEYRSLKHLANRVLDMHSLGVLRTRHPNRI